MPLVKRRTFIGAGALLTATAALGVGSALTLRWHVTPRRTEKLTAAHLNSLYDLPVGEGPRVLFVGNSMILRHDLPMRVGRLAAEAGVKLHVGVAAARGARLIETWQIGAFREVLAEGWDILVLQDFSTTCLRTADRWGSVAAMRDMAGMSGAEVVLYPTWAFPPGHRVYTQGGGWLSQTPAGPNDFAHCILTHYGGIAEEMGWLRAQVTEAFQPDATPWLEPDLHHPNVQGSDLIASEIWKSLQILVN